MKTIISLAVIFLLSAYGGYAAGRDAWHRFHPNVCEQFFQ